MSLVGHKTEVPQAATDFGYPWTPDGGDGSYRNPILYADYSDPDVVRHGEDYWMTSSSFNCTPGLPILHSTDLVNWTLVNHALKNIPEPRYAQVQPGCGVWAPSIRFHAGKFWIFIGMPDEGLYVITTDNPRGRWSEPQLLQAGKGLIDPCPLWDEDGSAYLVHAYAFSRSGQKHKLRVAPMAPDGTRLLGEGQIVFEQPERHPTLEGPKFLKHEGWYYILAPAGGVATGWQTVLRSRNVFGPYEDHIVLQQGRTPINGPHQGALVDTPSGDWWFLHFQDVGLYGRIVHLQPVEWRSGWPLMGLLNGGTTAGEPVLRHTKPNLPSGPMVVPATSDEFSSSKLGLQWQWQANHCDAWRLLDARDGWLRLLAQPATADLAHTPGILLQKFPARAFRGETKLDFHPQQDGDEAGLIVMGTQYAALAVRRVGQECQLVFRTNLTSEIIATLLDGEHRLSVTVADGGVCSFALRNADGTAVPVPQKFQAQPGKWIGAKVGIYCASAPGQSSRAFCDFDYFRFAAP